MIYNINGISLNSASDINGTELTNAYNLIGVIVFSLDPTLKKIKVMTYNVGQWYKGQNQNVPASEDAFYYALQNGMIARQNADILFLEEYWKSFSQTGRTAISMLSQHYPYIHEEGGESGYYGRCICSKYPISNYTVHAYANENQRYYDDCTITVDGKTFHVIITHLSTTAEGRASQIEELTEYLSSFDDFICGGDFNTPYSWTDVPRQEAMDELTPFFESGFKLANCSNLGYFITSMVSPPNSGVWRGWIDNICVSSGLAPISARTDDAKIEAYENGDIDRIDHIPFITEIQYST